ncbi:MAG: endolytic transglycosylase MltG, partial [Firmicutes bacterium]|nr:endolytic transglycosylase MltG [Bacillota bacterium]
MENNNIPEQEELEFLPEEAAEQSAAPDMEAETEPTGDTVHHDMLDHPDHGEEIIADEHAMAWHGMTHPTEPEPPFDLSVLEDPELDESQIPVDAPFVPEDEASAQEEADTESPVLDPVPVVTEERFRDQDFRDTFGDGTEFEEAFNAPKAEETVPTHDRPVRKGRPKKKCGELFFTIPHLAVTAVWLALILVIGVTLGRMLWVCAADVLAFGRDSKEVTVTVYENDTIDDITEKLHEAGLIRYPGLFKLYASLAVDEGEIAPGIWDLNTLYDYHALVNMMSPRSNREVIQVMIPEGYTCRQIFQLLEEKKVCTAVDIAAYAADGELIEYWFLENIQRGTENCLEGFLFPDTYEFYKNSSSREALEKMLDNFEYRFTEEMRAQIDTLNTNVTGGTFDIHDVVIVASLIEKETANNDESPMIASVIYNRLFNWGSTPAYLNIDAAIVYALDGKTDLTTEDLKVDSPYNTYLN